MIVTITGENSLMAGAELARLVQAFVAEHGDLAHEKLDGEEAEFERMQEVLQSLPFLASKKMVVLRAPSANKQFTEAAERLLSELPETTDVVLLEPKLDKRLSYYKYLKKATDFREFKELDRPALAKWLSARAKELGSELSTSDANYLIERAGQGQLGLGHELEKLVLYAPKVTKEVINLLTDASPQSTIFELVAAAFAGDRRRTQKLYTEQRQMKVEVPQIIAMLAWQLHVLALIKTAGERSAGDIATQAKISPFVVQKSSTIARSLSLTQLKKMIADLLELDIRLKREKLDADQALQTYLLSVSL